MRIRTLGVTEIAIVLVVLLLLFGAKRLPQTARGIAEAISEFRRGLRDGQGDTAVETE